MNQPPLLRLTVSALIATALVQGTAHAQSWHGVSNGLALGLPALAAYNTYQHRDADGAKQLTWALAGTLASTLALKSQIHAMRPDGSGNDSMPSGHTAMAFAAARFAHVRYGDSANPWALYGAATLTGLARVRANQHHWRDVFAGAALGYAWGTFASSKFSALPAGTTVSVSPQPHGLRVEWSQAW